MELLTPDKLALFVQEAQDFLSVAPVELRIDNVFYGYEDVTVEQGDLGGILGARFHMGESFSSIAAFPEESSHRTEYQLETSVGYLLIHIYPEDEKRIVIGFVRRIQ